MNNTDSPEREPATVDARDAARCYGFFARIMLEPIPVPGDGFGCQTAEQVRQLAALLGKGSADAMARELRSDHPGDLQQALAIDRTALFRGVDPQGLLPPYEAFWTGDESGLQSATAAYRQAGIEPTSGQGERPDYLGMELAFLEALAAAEAMRDPEQGPLLREMRRTFIDKHLSSWVPRYCEAATPKANTGFFRSFLALLPRVLNLAL